MKKIKRIPDETITSKIIVIRGMRVMLAGDLAELYQIETKRLNEQVRRNSERFPKDFMFQLTEAEVKNLKSHFATSSWGGQRILPFAFSEHGVLMLSSVLNTPRAIAVNIQIMRIYSKLRRLLMDSKNILLKLEKLEKKVLRNDEDIRTIFAYLKKLIEPEPAPMRKIGFRIPELKMRMTHSARKR